MTETNARIEAQVLTFSHFLLLIKIILYPLNSLQQARTQQLLQQNRELLEHIASLSGLNETDRSTLTPAAIGLAPQVSIELDVLAF